MRKYVTTDKQIDDIIHGLDKFISYVNGCHSGCLECYQDMAKANEQYKKNPETFFSDIGVSKEYFFDTLSYYRLLDVAIKTKNNIKDIHNVVIGMFINPEGNEYPIKVKEWLYDFKYFCYDEDGKFLTLEEQNNRLRNYPHFDASVKKPKCYNTQ